MAFFQRLSHRSLIKSSGPSRWEEPSTCLRLFVELLGMMRFHGMLNCQTRRLQALLSHVCRGLVNQKPKSLLDLHGGRERKWAIISPPWCPRSLLRELLGTCFLEKKTEKWITVNHGDRLWIFRALNIDLEDHQPISTLRGRFEAFVWTCLPTSRWISMDPGADRRSEGPTPWTERWDALETWWRWPWSPWSKISWTSSPKSSKNGDVIGLKKMWNIR